MTSVVHRKNPMETRRRAGGIASTGTDVVLTTPSVVEPNNNLDAPPTPRRPIEARLLGKIRLGVAAGTARRRLCAPVY
jgi:hypothetical protein